MTAETRLAALATKLTPLERARLLPRADFAEETLDASLLRAEAGGGHLPAHR